jgi:hypothetical protein
MPRQFTFYRSIACLFALVLLPTVSLGQETGGEAGESKEIETDRDSFTPSTSTVERGRWILESAYSFVDNRRVYETHSYPEIILRHGISEFMELRLGWNYEVGGAGSPISGNLPSEEPEESKLERESRMLYGTKILVSDQRGMLPQSSFILQGLTPTYGEVTATQMSATYAFGWTLRNSWVLDFATRYGTGSIEEDHFNTWSPSTVIKVPVGERWKVHAEYFGVFTDGRAKETTQHFFSPGAHYLISKNFEIGSRVGWGLNDQSPNSFINVGFGWQY